MKIDIANNSAESASLGQVTIVSKSGHEPFRGCGVRLLPEPDPPGEEPVLDARASGVIHFGLALGGPAVIPRLYDGRGRTFWFVSGETVNGSSASADLNPTVPLEAWRRGDFFALGIPIRNPLTGEVYADGRIPQSALNPVSRLQDRFYPLPNSGSAPRSPPTTFVRPWTTDRSKPYYATARVDHNFGDKDRIFARFTFHQATNPVWEGNLPAIGMRQQLRQNKALTFSTRGFSARRSSTSSDTATPTTTTRSPGRFAASRSWTPSACAGSRRSSRHRRNPESQLPRDGPHRAIADRRRESGFLNRIHQIQDQVTWLRGTHSLKFGTDIRRVDWEDLIAPASLFGRSTSPGGSPATLRRLPARLPNTGRARFRRSRRCATLDLRLLRAGRLEGPRNLTVNLGLRYDLHPGWVEREGRLAFFDTTAARSSSPTTASTRSRR